MDNLCYDIYQISQSTGQMEFIHVGEHIDNVDNIKKLMMMSIEKGIEDMLQQMQGKNIGRGQVIMPYIYFDLR